MDPTTFLNQMKKSQTYDQNIKSIELLQTHISYVFLTGTYAYKIKKPVNFGFLDFSTLEKRKHFCEEELRLNQRLCPDMYLSVVPITIDNDHLRINGKGTIIEYAVKMRQFPQEKIMTNLLKTTEVTKKTIHDLCTTLISFYQTNQTTAEITSYGQLSAVKQNIDENFEQTKNKIGITITEEQFSTLQQINNQFFTKQYSVFQQRVNQGFIHDCHGDLHTGNIVLDNTIYIFDCIEFNKRFRYCDIASDIGFLAMDLDFLNHPFLSSTLIHCYREQSQDTHIYELLNFYKCYRAYVRGKVTGFKLDDPQITPEDKKKAIQTAQKYFTLAMYYARLLHLQLTKKHPILYLVGGLTGTGKSTLAEKIAVDHRAILINTDIVRKEQAGLDKYQKHHDAFNTGLYVPENIDKTYEKVIEKAETTLKHHHSVVLDATFVYQKHRQLAEDLTQTLNIPLINIHCTCPPEIVKQRLTKRQTEKTVSDGRWEIYQQQRTTMDPFTKTST